MSLIQQQQLNVNNILRGAHSLPFLFLGSGVSLRYLSTMNWDGLLKHFASLVDDSDLAFEKYKSRASRMLSTSGRESTKNNLSTQIADLIEADFNDHWFTDSKYEDNRRMFREEIQSGVTPFKLEIANLLGSVNMEFVPANYAEEVELLRKIGKKSVAGMITTNYDPFANLIYPDFDVYIGQEELLFSQTQGVGEIYKIHGCTSKPNSIVINSRDYHDFDKRNAYLAAKLMTIFVEHPIVFLGYSLEDENIQAIIKAIVDCLSEENLGKLRDRLIFVEWKEGHPTTDVLPHTRDFGSGKMISMTKVITDSYTDLFKSILGNKAKYPTKLLRKLKQDMYRLALTNESAERILVMPMAEDQLDTQDIEVVIGFGLVELGRQGYKGISAEQVFRDIVFDTQNFNTNFLVHETLPELLKHVAFSLPVYKYIAEYDYANLPEVFSRFTTARFDSLLANNSILTVRRRFNFSSVDEAIDRGADDVDKQMFYLQTVAEQNMDADKLEEYLDRLLNAYPDILVNGAQMQKTTIKKLIRMLDYLKYKK